MVVYFRGPCVRITHELFELLCPTYQGIPIKGLSHPRVVQQTTDPPVANALRAASTGVAGTTAVAAGLAWLQGWQVFVSPLVAFVVLGMLVVAVVTAAACARHRTVEQVLAADYEGAPVVLYHSADPVAFGQVRRGLTRALEQLGDPR